MFREIWCDNLNKLSNNETDIKKQYFEVKNLTDHLVDYGGKK